MLRDFHPFLKEPAVVRRLRDAATELRKTKKSLLVLSPAALSQPVLQPPVTPACVSSPFGWRHAVGPHAPAGFHNGIDLPAPAGALVHAAAGGVVEVIKRQGLGGVTIHLRHPGGLVTLYAHLGNLVPAIAAGKRNVAAGRRWGQRGRGTNGRVVG